MQQYSENATSIAFWAQQKVNARNTYFSSFSVWLPSHFSFKIFWRLLWSGVPLKGEHIVCVHIWTAIKTFQENSLLVGTKELLLLHPAHYADMDKTGIKIHAKSTERGQMPSLLELGWDKEFQVLQWQKYK